LGVILLPRINGFKNKDYNASLSADIVGGLFSMSAFQFNMFTGTVELTSEDIYI
jgi:hypothetical protein